MTEFYRSTILQHLATIFLKNVIHICITKHHASYTGVKMFIFSYNTLMRYYEVAPLKIIRSGIDLFTYESERQLPIGSIVHVEVGKSIQLGVVIKQTKKPEYQTKQIILDIDVKPIPDKLIKLAIWMSTYYLAPLSSVLNLMLPKGIIKKRRYQELSNKVAERPRTNILFNKEQIAVINRLKTSDSGTFLLQGVTGSGKTQIYIDIASNAIKNGKSVIVLVPEIALTSQIVSEFSNHFSDLIVTHSRMNEAKRHLIWLEAINSQTPSVVVGPRSALFTPINNIGAIIIDEAHEPSYKQELSPKYSALRVATMLGRLHNCLVIFGSATPSIVDRYLADQADKKIVRLNKVAKKNSIPPQVSLIDMTKRENFKKHYFISNIMLEKITDTLKQNKQVLIFHNRRGSANSTLCKQCGWIAMCPRCHVPLNLHSDKNQLLCHICGHTSKVATSCPDCGNIDVVYKGIGTKLIESELKKLFPEANIARFDNDNLEKETVYNRYQELYDGTINIIVGTQVIAKGLDLPNLRTVGIIQADTGLSMPDFNSTERTFQLLAQVVGRVGRDSNKTSVVVQSYRPDHPSIQFGLTQDYESFYNKCLKERQIGIFPPFTHLLKLVCVYKTEESAIKNSKMLAEKLRKLANSSVQILGPTPAFHERQNNNYRWQLVLKSPKREYLINLLVNVPATHWQSELDPTSLL